MISYIEVENFGPFEKARLELANQGLVYITAENRDTDAADNNGSGKTSLFKALTWGLYDKVIDGYDGDSVIRRGAKRATVNIGFLDGHRLERSRTKGKPRVILFDKDDKPVKLSKPELQTAIVNRVGGLDFASFKNTVLYGQNDSARFADNTTKDADRKDILHRILKTEILKSCHKWAKDETLQLKHKRDELVEKIDVLEAKAEEHDVESLQQKFDGWQEERDEDVGDLVDEAKQARNQSKELEGLKDGVPKLRKQIKKLQDDLGKCDEAKRESSEMAEDLEKAGNKVESKEGEVESKEDEMSENRLSVAKIETKIGGVEEELERFDDGICPFCTSPLDDGHPLEHKNELTKKLEGLSSELNELEEENSKVAGGLGELKAELGELNAELGELEETRDALDEIADGASRISRQISTFENEILQANHSEERAKDFVEKAQKALKRAKARKAEENPFEALLEDAKKKTKEFKAKVKKHNAALETIRDELAHFEFWVRGFGNQGLPSFVLDSVMPYLTERTNDYLGILADGDITVEFSTQRELKSGKGEVRDEIEITWTIEGEDDVPPSGGQGKKIEISVGLALMDLVTAREGGGVDMIALDEVLDGLDREGRARVLQLLQNLRARRGSIFVISHETDVSEVFEKTVTVVKEGGIARLELAA